MHGQHTTMPMMAYPAYNDAIIIVDDGIRVDDGIHDACIIYDALCILCAVIHSAHL